MHIHTPRHQINRAGGRARPGQRQRPRPRPKRLLSLIPAGLPPPAVRCPFLPCVRGGAPQGAPRPPPPWTTKTKTKIAAITTPLCDRCGWTLMMTRTRRPRAPRGSESMTETVEGRRRVRRCAGGGEGARVRRGGDPGDAAQEARQRRAQPGFRAGGGRGARRRKLFPGRGIRGSWQVRGWRRLGCPFALLGSQR